jgi:putative endonuclease
MVWQHRNDVVEGFTKKYGVHKLVYYEWHEDMENAILREKRIKKWNRAWKLRIIEEMNSNWSDLYEALVTDETAPAPKPSGFPPTRE